MNRKKLDAAMETAHRFLAHAEQLIDEDNKVKAHKAHHEHAWMTSPFYGSRASGAVRRASMDLTRVLADLRKAG